MCLLHFSAVKFSLLSEICVRDSKISSVFLLHLNQAIGLRSAGSWSGLSLWKAALSTVASPASDYFQWSRSVMEDCHMVRVSDSKHTHQWWADHPQYSWVSEHDLIRTSTWKFTVSTCCKFKLRPQFWIQERVTGLSLWAEWIHLQPDERVFTTSSHTRVWKPLSGEC